jgi:hypothetical protein
MRLPCRPVWQAMKLRAFYTDPFGTEFVRVLRFNVDSRVLRDYMLFTPGQMPAMPGLPPPVPGSVRLESARIHIEFLGDGRFAESIKTIKAGQVLESGRIIFDLYSAIGAGIGEGAEYETLFTVEGDYLKILRGGIDYPPEEMTAEDAAGNTLLFKRLDCAN